MFSDDGVSSRTGAARIHKKEKGKVISAEMRKYGMCDEIDIDSQAIVRLS